MEYPEKTIARIIVYRKLLVYLKYQGKESIFSHDIANLASTSSAQVRRDLMIIGYKGTPAKGYRVSELERSIDQFLDNPDGEKIAIVGMGKLGSSLSEYCYWNCHNLDSLFGFDSNEALVGKEISNARVFHIDQLEKIVENEGIRIAVIAVPSDIAQVIADRLVEAGIKGIMNYCPVQLELPEHIHIENRDMIMSLEKVSYIARN